MRNNLFPMAMILLLMSSLLVFSVSADIYPNIGYNSFQAGDGIFNEDLSVSEAMYYILNLNSLKQPPIIDDFNSDGINDIFIISEDSAMIYQGKNLVFNVSFDYGADQTISNIISNDIDGDGNKEIIFSTQTSENIYILNYNGTHLINTSFNYDVNNSHTVLGDIIIGCADDESDNCIIVFGELLSGAGTIYMKAYKFTSSGISGSVSTIASNPALGMFCFPRIKTMEYADYDFDGTKEFIISALSVAFTTTAEDVYTIWINNDGTSPSTELFKENQEPGNVVTPTDVGDNCEEYNAGIYVSPPLVGEYKSSAGLETLVAYQEDSNSFRIRLYEADGDMPSGDIFPQTAIFGDADSQLISNVFKADVFPDASSSFCAIGYWKTDSELKVVCGSKFTSETPETKVFTYSITDGYNISSTRYDMLAHSTDMKVDTYDGMDISEISSSYGILALNMDSCGVTGNCDAYRLFQNAIGSAAVQVIDYENIGSSDLLISSLTQLVYIDDTISNEPAEITSLQFNPCITGSVLKANTTLSVYVIVTDQTPSSMAADKVSANVTIYYQSADAVSQSTINFTSGTGTYFNFIVNKTGYTNQIIIQAWDSANPSTKDTKIRYFDVANDGLEYGDSSCTEDFTITPSTGTTNASIIDTIPADSNLVNGLEDTASLLGLSVFLLYILLMGVVALGMFIYLKEHSIGAIAIVEALMLIFGVKLGIIGYGIIIFISIIGIIVIGVWLSSRFMGNKGGG